MNKGWYYFASKNDKLFVKESDINWRDVGKGLGWGAGLGSASVGLGFLANNLPNQQPKPIQNSYQLEMAPKEKFEENTQNKTIEQKNEQVDQKPSQIVSPKINKTSFVSDKDLESFISPWEGGAKSRAYKDSKGIWTIGIGFNLESPNADTILKQIGANKSGLISHKTSLSKEQMSSLFKINLKTAIEDAKKWIPNLESHPKEVQKICVDLSFNMGGPRLSKFKITRENIINKNYKEAAYELEKSEWFGQVGNRSKHHVSVLKNL